MLIRLAVAALISFPFLSQLPLLFLYVMNGGQPAQTLIWWAHYTSAVGAMLVVIPLAIVATIIFGLLKLLSLFILSLFGLDLFNWLAPE